MISFGPVPSRRLGKSLGINNIISPKTCSYDCVYCQVGKTRVKSISRDLFYEPSVILDEVTKHLKRLNKENYPDYLTFVSNGEPTLDKKLGKSIKLLKKTGLPIAVISNGSMLFDESVRQDLLLAEWVSLKMDASDNKTWQELNKPFHKLDFEKHIENVFLFASIYKGILNTETMVVRGINDNVKNFSGVAEMISSINPRKAYLSIPTRPPSDKTVMQPDPGKLAMAWQIFDNKKISAELLTGFEGTDTGFTGNIYEDILNITAVHPLREDSLAELLKKDKSDYQIVEALLKQKLIKSTTYKGRKFFVRQYHFDR